jgi:hypothetical protein
MNIESIDSFAGAPAKESVLPSEDSLKGGIAYVRRNQA